MVFPITFPETCLSDAPYEMDPETIVFELVFNPGYYVGYVPVSPGGKRAEEMDRAQYRSMAGRLKAAVETNNVREFRDVLNFALSIIETYSVDHMETIKPSRRLLSPITEVTPAVCMNLIQDLCCLLMCNSQPLRVIQAQKVTIRVLNYAYLPEPTVENVVECYYIFFLYLRHYKIDFINAKIQSKHYITRDIMWLTKRGLVSVLVT